MKELKVFLFLTLFSKGVSLLLPILFIPNVLKSVGLEGYKVYVFLISLHGMTLLITNTLWYPLLKEMSLEKFENKAGHEGFFNYILLFIFGFGFVVCCLSVGVGFRRISLNVDSYFLVIITIFFSGLIGCISNYIELTLVSSNRHSRVAVIQIVSVSIILLIAFSGLMEYVGSYYLAFGILTIIPSLVRVSFSIQSGDKLFKFPGSFGLKNLLAVIKFIKDQKNFIFSGIILYLAGNGILLLLTSGMETVEYAKYSIFLTIQTLAGGVLVTLGNYYLPKMLQELGRSAAVESSLSTGVFVKLSFVCVIFLLSVYLFMANQMVGYLSDGRFKFNNFEVLVSCFLIGMVMANHVLFVLMHCSGSVRSFNILNSVVSCMVIVIILYISKLMALTFLTIVAINFIFGCGIFLFSTAVIYKRFVKDEKRIGFIP